MDRPPERSGDRIDASNYSSLQAAHDALSEGDTLFIPSGTYVERFTISQDHITIESNDAWVVQPDNNETHAVGMGDPGHNSDASLVGSHDNGDKVIRVSDASPFSIGDDIYIAEYRRPYGEPQSGGASGADTTHEYRTVTSVDPTNDTITVHYPILLPYPNIENTEVGVMDWFAEDVHITGLNIRGTDPTDRPDSRPFQIQGGKDVWADNMQIEDGGRNAMYVSRSMRTRLDQIDLGPSQQYGINVFHGSTHTMITNVTANNIGRYAVRFGIGGGTSRCSSDGYVDGVTGINGDSSFVTNVHWGGFFVNFYNVEATASKVLRIRSRHITLDGFESYGNSQNEFATRQRPFHCTVKNGNIYNKQDGLVFLMNLRGEDGGVYGNERGGDLTFENISIEPYGDRDITEIGFFHENCEIDGLHFKNITYDGQQLERPHVESWANYDSANITNLTVD
ncbi:hypothetical protein ACFQKF_13735 [Halalkalicoccus sp. GCM10025322]